MQNIPALDLRTSLAVLAAPYIAALRRDAWLYAFIAFYAGVALFVSLAVGVPGKFIPHLYAQHFAPGFMTLSILACGWGLCSGEPVKVLRWVVGPQGVASAALAAALLIHFGIFTSAKTLMVDIAPFFADRLLADVDEAIHGGMPWEYLAAVLPAELTGLACLFYIFAWLALIKCSVLAAMLLPQLSRVRTQYLWTHVLVWPILGNIIALGGFSAGPIYYANVTGDSVRFAELTAFLHANLPEFFAGVVRHLWEAHLSGGALPGTGISAFPSLHVASATLIALLAWQCHRVLAAAGVAFSAAILLLSVYLGWHYAVDGYFSILATILLWKAVGCALARWSGDAVRRVG